MTPTTCFSSDMMSAVMTWRNLQGREENWVQGPQNNPSIGKKITAEVASVCIAVASVVETVVYYVLSTMSMFILPCTEQPFRFFTDLIESSLFTVIWAVANAAMYNLFFLNIMTRESFARRYAEDISPFPEGMFFRFQDQRHLANWNQNQAILTLEPDCDPMLGHIVKYSREVQEKIENGKRCITENILQGADENIIDLLDERDPKVYLLVLTKCIYIYVLGEKRTEPIPEFFKRETRKEIEKLGQYLSNVQRIVPIEDILKDLDAFKAGPVDDDARLVFNHLKCVALNELLGSLFFSECLPRACEEFKKE